jgi:hypothetical protein
MNLVIPGGRELSSTSLLETLVRKLDAKTVGEDCLLYILCRSLDGQDQLSSISRFSNKFVALIAGLAISDFFGENWVKDSNIFEVVNSQVYCSRVKCSY